MTDEIEKPNYKIEEPNRAFEYPMLVESFKALTAEYGRRLNREIGLEEVDLELDEIRIHGFEDTLNNPESLVLVARDERGQIIGLLAADSWEEKNEFVKPPYIEIFELMIDENWQNKGIGSKLLESAEAWCRSHGVENITLTAQEFNIGAIKLYESKGYKTIHRLMLKKLW
ncbi:MAG: GNAT family N-acetyltransferase [Caldisericia bacterium]|nr:GNAT family N-acetyltransferase [Caldisericia bacterium]